MTNTPKKAKDPTEAALSAIQEALNVRDADMKAPAIRPPVAPKAATTPAASDPRHGDLRAQRSPAADDDIFDDSHQPAAGEQPRRAANDDQQTIGQILQTLQPRASRLPYIAATVCSLAWIVAAYFVTSAFLPNLETALGEQRRALLVLTGGAVFLAPIIFFYVVANMLARSRELRIIAQSMAEVAMRLAEPESAARESIVTVGQAIRREVAAMGDGVERALARAAELETLVHNEVSALERAYNDNEVRIRGLLEDLAHQRNNLVGQAEQVRDAITSVHLDLSQDISSVSDLVAAQVNTAAQQITHSLAETGEHITMALGRAGDSMIGTLGERGGDILERLEHTSASTTQAISNATEQLTSSLDLRTDHVTREFEDLSDNLMQAMQLRLANVANDFAQRSTTIIDLMADRSQQITNNLLETSSQIAETIVTRGDEVNNTLKSTGDSLVLDISLRGGDLVSKLEQTSTKVTDSIISRSNTILETFQQNADAIGGMISTRGDALTEVLSSRLHSFEEMFTRGGTELTEKISHDSSTLGNLITRHLGEFDRTVKTYGGELVDRLGERTQSITDSMRSYIDNFDQRLTVKTDDVTGGLDQRLERFQEALDARTQTLNDALASRVMDIAKTLAEGGKEVVAALDKRINDVTGTINTRGARLAETIGGKIEEIDKTLGSRVLEITTNLDTRIGRFEELLVGRTENAAQQVETRAKAAADVLSARAIEVANNLETRMGHFEEVLTGRTESVAQQVEARAKAAAELLDTTSDSVRQGASDLERTLKALSSGVSNTLKHSASEVERTLLGASAEVARSFISKADEISSAVTSRAHEMTRILDSSSSTLLTSLTSKSSEFTAEVNRATAEAVKAIEAKGFDFTKTMFDNSGELARLINEASELATGRVNATLKGLQNEAKLAVEQSQQTTAAAVSEMLETHNMLRSDTTALFERLREANILLQEVIVGAHDNMHSLEAKLTDRTNEFSSAINEVTERSGIAADRVSTHVAAFQNTTSQILDDLSQLAAQFESHGRVLVQAVDLIDKSNRKTDETITERRTALDSLLATLDIKTDDLEQRLKRFSGLLGDSLDNATTRARDIGRLIAEASSTGTRTLTEQFELVRNTTEQERKLTSEALQQIYEQATGDAHAMFRQSTERFADVLQSIKQMAAEMQQELDATRTELRRGVLELPQETAESAAQMRRVIVEQIEALAELNRIVARHGRSVETAEPRRTVREEPALAVVGGGRSEAPRSPFRSEIGAPPSAPVSPIPPAARRADVATLGATQTNRGSGWLSELLHRASRDDAEQPSARAEDRQPRKDDRQPRHTIESLDALSVDIARMIDHDAAADLWDRYNRGERNVFTRRLYTLQGQKAFDEIRTRYRSDREFKQTVDRYVSEFERLLEDVSRDDRGQVVVRTYLTSETGKVYTMLAHAAGRFD